MPTDMRERHRTAVEGIRTSTPDNEPQRREALQNSDDEIERHNPAYKAAVDQERRHYKQEHRAAPKAEAAAKQDDAVAKKDDAEAKRKGSAVQSTGQRANNDRQAAASSKNKLDAALGP